MGILAEMWIGFMANININSIDRDVESLQTLEPFEGNFFKICRKRRSMIMDNYFHTLPLALSSVLHFRRN
jgi:hypothetical protein